MQLRQVLRVALALVTALGLAVVVNTPAESAARLAAPRVAVAADGSGLVSVKGRTPRASQRVRVDRRTGSGWAVVKRIRARHHRYATKVRVTPGTRATFRVVSRKRVRKFTVQATAAAPKLAAPKVRPTYDDCGLQPRKANGRAWACTFHDDFDGTDLDRTKWIPHTYFVTRSDADVHACYRDHPDNVNVAGGMLNLSLVRLPEAAPCSLAVPETEYMSGSVSTYHLFSQQYGRFESRIKMQASTAPGLHEAFWLWPDNRYSEIGWPDSGEIDVAETFSNYSSVVGSYLHYSLDHKGLFLGVNAQNCTANRGEWNTYTLDWGPSRIQTYVNGKPCLLNTSGDPAFQKRYIINLTQGIGGAPWNRLEADTPVPATMSVDYVRVWS